MVYRVDIFLGVKLLCPKIQIFLKLLVSCVLFPYFFCASVQNLCAGVGSAFCLLQWDEGHLWASSVSDIFLTGWFSLGVVNHFCSPLCVISILQVKSQKLKNAKQLAYFNPPEVSYSLDHAKRLKNWRGWREREEGGYDENNHPRPWIQSHRIVGGILLVKQ